MTRHVNPRVAEWAGYATIIAGLAVVADGIIRSDTTDILVGVGLLGGPALLNRDHDDAEAANSAPAKR